MYDALNVLSAIGVVQKVSNKISLKPEGLRLLNLDNSPPNEDSVPAAAEVASEGPKLEAEILKTKVSDSYEILLAINLL